jgi:hypothetical protein
MSDAFDDFDESAMFSPAAVSGNPLAKYFRQPGLHIDLPTRGAFLRPEQYNPTMAGQIPVLPMRAADELLLSSPDALMSGYAIEKLLESCVPDIKAPRAISTPDLDVILLAIRAATYGNTMEIQARCPKCGHNHEMDCDLGGMLAGMVHIELEDGLVRLSDEILVYTKPFDMEIGTRIAMVAYDVNRMIQEIEEDTPEAERSQIRNAAHKRLTDLSVRSLAESITKVVVPNNTVTKTSDIAEFLSNIPKPWFEKIEKTVDSMNSKGLDKGVNVQCEACQHEWKSDVEFDPSSFFAKGS